MVHATERKLCMLVFAWMGEWDQTNPRRNEKPLLPQPEPSVTVVNTHCGLCLFGVRMRRAIQMAIDARTAWLLDACKLTLVDYSLLIGANQRMIRCNQFVGKEQIVPNKHSTKMASRTV
jgi:hypothetical protein